MKVNKNVMSALQRKTAEEIAEKKGLSFCVTVANNTKGEREITVERFEKDFRENYQQRNFKTYPELTSWLKSFSI